jgi:hypothetical protein
VGRNPVRRREEEDKIGIELVPHPLIIIIKVRFCIVVFLIMCHSCFFMSNFLKTLPQFFFSFTFYLAIKEYYFSNYYQYVLDSDMVLSSSDSDESSLSGNVQEDCGCYCY